MALSGGSSHVPTTGYRLRLAWSASQNIAGNSSTITAILYWESTTPWHNVNAGNVQKSGFISIDGTSFPFSNNASLNPSQSREIARATKTVPHNGDGSRQVHIAGYFTPAVTLNGAYIGQIGAGETPWLNQIPRASKLLNNPNWTMPNNATFSISRASGSFTHTLTLVGKKTDGVWYTIATRTGQGTSSTFAFSDAEHKLMATILQGRTSCPTEAWLTTYNGGTQIGSVQKYAGTLTPPMNVVLQVPNHYVGQTVTATYGGWHSGIERNPYYFNSTFTVNGVVVKTMNNVRYTVGKNPTVSFTETEKNAIYNQMKTTNSAVMVVNTTTYWDGVQIRTPWQNNNTVTVINSEPIFTTARYEDIATGSLAITGNNQFLIEGKSQLRVFIDTANLAVAQNSATISNYILTYGSETQTVSNQTSGFSVTFNTVNTSNSVSIKVLDSRGNSTVVPLGLTVIPYSPPRGLGSVTRKNNFETQTTVKLNGTISSLIVNNVQKNGFLSVKYRFKKQIDATWGSLINFSYTTNGMTFIANDVVVDLDMVYAWDFQIQIQDKLTTTIIDNVVPIGQPIFFLDAEQLSVGINGYAVDGYKLHVDGSIKTTRNLDAFMVYTEGVVAQAEGINSPKYLGRTTGFLTDNQQPLMMYDHVNGNVSLSALGKDLYLGYYNTEKNVLWKGLYDKTGKKLIANNDGDVMARRLWVGYDAGESFDNNFSGIEMQSNNNMNWIDFHIGSQNNDYDARISARVGQAGTAGKGEIMFQSISQRFRSTAYGGEIESIMVGNQWRAGYNVTNMYVNPAVGGALAVRQDNSDGAFRPIQASAFNVNSTIKAKTNVKEMSEEEINYIFDTTNVYEYYLKDDVENGNYWNRQIGLITEMSNEAIRDEAEGINIYNMSATNWKKTQIDSKRIYNLEKKVSELQETIDIILDTV